MHKTQPTNGHEQHLVIWQIIYLCLHLLPGTSCFALWHIKRVFSETSTRLEYSAEEVSAWNGSVPCSQATNVRLHEACSLSLTLSLSLILFLSISLPLYHDSSIVVRCCSGWWRCIASSHYFVCSFSTRAIRIVANGWNGQSEWRKRTKRQN